MLGKWHKMTLNRKIVQLGLISIGILLIIATYFLYPEINKKKKALEQDIIIDQDFKTSEKESNKGSPKCQNHISSASVTLCQCEFSFSFNK